MSDVLCRLAHPQQLTYSQAVGTTFVGSLAQSYAVGALINATGTLSYKGASYLGGLIFLATSAPTVSLTQPPPKVTFRTC